MQHDHFLLFQDNSNIGWLESYQRYYARIFEKHSDETLEDYIERLGELKARLPSLGCWLDNEYMTYVKPYLEPYRVAMVAAYSLTSSDGRFTTGRSNDENKNKGFAEQDETKKVISRVQKKSQEISNEDTGGDWSVDIPITGPQSDETGDSMNNQLHKIKKDDKDLTIKRKPTTDKVSMNIVYFI